MIGISEAMTRANTCSQRHTPEPEVPGVLQARPDPIVYRPSSRIERWASWWIGFLFSWRVRRWFPRISRTGLGIIKLTYQVPEYWRVKHGPETPVHIKAERLDVCRKCPSCIRRVRLMLDSAGHKYYDVGMFCDACDCGTAPRADLRVKLGYLLHECPQGRHADGWGRTLPKIREEAQELDDAETDNEANCTTENGGCTCHAGSGSGETATVP